MKRRWFTIAGLALATLSCQLILGLEAPTGAAAPEDDEEAGPPAAKDPCDHAYAPKEPTTDDAGDAKLAFWFATQKVTVPLDPKAGLQGFDIDKACTCGKDLRDGGPSCVSKTTVCDLGRGVDDALGSAFEEARNIPGGYGVDAVQPINKELGNGVRTLLVYVSEYNGEANDRDVRVAFVNSGGLYTKAGCDGADRPLTMTLHDFKEPPTDTPVGRDRYAPAYDGCDYWSAEMGILATGTRTPGLLSKGWVTNNQLVVPIDTIATTMFGNLSIIHSALFVAKITTENGHRRLDGVLAGRMPFTDLYQALGSNQVGDGDGDGGYTALCEKPEIWGLLAVPRLCQARDVMIAEGDDFKGRSCDAASMNIGFTMIESKIADFDFTNPPFRKTCAVVPCP